jgi:hypothetical protein
MRYAYQYKGNTSSNRFCKRTDGACVLQGHKKPRKKLLNDKQQRNVLNLLRIFSSPITPSHATLHQSKGKQNVDRNIPKKLT